ncbi:putative TPR repeat-containing thioredoxin TTL1-4 [Helianthus annuus]|nr:putative TPR repeat-containing thioredoxin TTL1-4 [Helianthus annuus]
MEHAQKVFDEMSLPNVLEKACSLDQNKPDFKELDLGIGGMRSINKEQDQFRRRSNRSHSGELNATSIPNITTPEKVRSGFGDVNRKLGHRRSYSTGAPLIYSGSGTGTMGYFNGSSNNTASTSSTTTTTNSGGSGSGGSGGNSSVNSPNTSLYPAGNICPSGNKQISLVKLLYINVFFFLLNMKV